MTAVSFLTLGCVITEGMLSLKIALKCWLLQGESEDKESIYT